jgi:cyclophilin family peptidyl-prolyl cis-trans isomerase
MIKRTKMIKKLKFIFLLIILSIISCKSTSYKNLNDGLYADIETDKGAILLQLNFEDVPITVANFVALAEGNNNYVADKYKGKPFYDGLKFHRVVKNFIIQGGDPIGSGKGGPGYQFEDEFPTNDEGNLLLKHDKAGVLSMANAGPDNNGSQFFITLKPSPHLDGRHTIFGHVIQGQKVVDSIEQNDIMNKVKIIRVGSGAKNFKAAKLFSDYFKKLEEEAKTRLEKIKIIKEEFLKNIEIYRSQAESLPSGLKIFYLNKSNGKQPKLGTNVNVFYAGYFTTGDLLDSNIKEVAKSNGKYDQRRDEMGGYATVQMEYSPDAKLIQGFKDGLQRMKIGDKVVLFIPSYLAYGAQGYGPVPPDTDLIFELEIVDDKK